MAQRNRAIDLFLEKNMRSLGKHGPTCPDLGLGCMGMSGTYGPADETESIATIHAALDAGINLLDTGDYYGMGHNEMLIRRALQGRDRSKVLISVKFGSLRDPRGNWLGSDGRPVAVKNALAYSLQRLGTDYVDIYRLGRVDPNVPTEETIGAIADMVKAGYVRYIGLSEAGPDTVRRAQSVHPISDLQIEYSLLSRNIEAEILPVCRELGIGITAYGILSRGLIGGNWSKEQKVQGSDFRAHAPRFQGSNLDQNLKLVEGLRAFASAKGATVAQVAIVWILSRGTDIIPLIGVRSRGHLNEALGATQVALTSDDLARIERLVPAGAAAGERYAQQVMATLDSERKEPLKRL
jgi:aryl-alcohol dehydrogenase-like predicted oxidoreductase